MACLFRGGSLLLVWQFYAGDSVSFAAVKNIVWVQTSIYANTSLLQLKAGVHPQQPPYPSHTVAAVSGVRSAIESNAKKAQFYACWQFRLLIIFYRLATVRDGSVNLQDGDDSQRRGISCPDLPT